jgi:hypothetical protein
VRGSRPWTGGALAGAAVGIVLAISGHHRHSQLLFATHSAMLGR